MAVSTMERALPRARAWEASGSALACPVWVEPVRHASAPVPRDEPIGVVIPLHPVPPAVTDPPVRLTRRGRLTASIAVAACVLAVTGLAYSSSAQSSGRPISTPAASAVVQPGETLWEIAVRADPQGDPQVTVARIIELNDLSGGHIRPGQRLLLPAR